MMDEYVKKQDILNNLEWHDKNCGEINYWGAVEVVEHTIPADVAPVRHGRWINSGTGYNWCYECSVCGWKDGRPFEDRHNYCPNCGAKMEGGATNEAD